MPLTVACACGQHYAVAEEYAGQQVSCPLCGRRLTVTDPMPAPPPTIDEETLLVSCPCGQEYSTPRQFAGQQVNCPACGRMLVISDPAASASIGACSSPSLTLPPLPQTSSARPLVVPLLFVILLVGGMVGAALFLAVRSQMFEETETTATAKEAHGEAPSSDAKTRPASTEKEASPPVEKTPEHPRKDYSLAPEPAPAPSPAVPAASPPALSEFPWRGHAARILQVSFTQDGKSVLTASGGRVEKDGKETIAADSTLRRWDAATGKELDRWQMNDKGIAAAAFSPDGRLAAIVTATAPSNTDVVLWDRVARKQVKVLAAHTKPIRCLAFSPNGKQLLSGAEDNFLVLWDVATGKVVHELKAHTNAPNQVVFSPNGKQALSCGMDHSARLWDLDGGRQLRQFTGHADIVWAVAFSPNGQLALTGCGMQMLPGIGLAAGGRDYEIRLWDTATGKEQRRFSGHTSAVTALAFDSTGARFLSGSHDGNIRLWQIDTGKELRRYDGHDGRVRAVAFFPNGRRALSAGEDGRLRTWALPLDVSDLIADLRGEEAASRLRAIADLAKRPEDARAAVPALFQALLRPDAKLRERVLQLLRDLLPLDKEHVLRLDRLLADRSYREGQRFALDALVALGADAGPAAKGLLKAIADKDPIIRGKAMKALVPVAGELGKDGFGPLLEALRDADEKFQAGAEAALAKLGTPPAEHVPALRGLLQEKRQALRRIGLKALGDMGAEAHKAIADIVARAREEPTAPMRALAIVALVRIAPRDEMTIAVCTKALADRDVTVCRQAAKGLAESGAVPGLLRALRHEDADVSKIAGDALDRVTYEKAHAPLLVPLLESKDESIRLRGIDVFGKLAADGTEGVLAMSKLLRSAGAEERKHLLAAFQEMGPAAKDAGASLALLLKDKDLAVRFEVCKTLIRIDARELTRAVSVLIDVLRPAKAEKLEEEVEENKDREKARELLVSIGKPAIKGLVHALESDFAAGGARTQTGIINGVARLEVIKVLIAMGKDANRNDVLVALAALERKDPFSGVRKAAREARVRLQRKE